MKQKTRDRFEAMTGETARILGADKLTGFRALVEMMGHLLFGYAVNFDFREKRKAVGLNANIAVGLVLEHYYIDHNETDIFNTLAREYYPGIMRQSDIYLNAATVIGEVIDKIYGAGGKVNIIAPNAGTGTVIMIIRHFLERDFSLPAKYTKEIRYVGYVQNATFKTMFLMNVMFSIPEMVEKFMIGKALDVAGKERLLNLYRKLAGVDSKYICIVDEGKLIGDNSTIITDRRT